MQSTKRVDKNISEIFKLNKSFYKIREYWFCKFKV